MSIKNPNFEGYHLKINKSKSSNCICIELVVNMETYAIMKMTFGGRATSAVYHNTIL